MFSPPIYLWGLAGVCAAGFPTWLLWRQNLQNYFRSMTVVEAAALDSALRGRRFSQICEDLRAWLPDDEIPLAAATLLGNWADSGIIIALR